MEKSPNSHPCRTSHAFMKERAMTDVFLASIAGEHVDRPTMAASS